MKQEVQLIVRKGENIKVLSISDVPTLGGVGSQRIVVDAFPNQLQIDDTFVELYNAAGQSSIHYCNSVSVDTPVVGQTRLNFSSVFPFDYRVSRGGYFFWGDAKEFFLDLYENESISQNWNFTDISDFKVVGSYSRQFRIPLTQRNQEALGAIGEVNYLTNEQNDTVFNTKIPAEIRVNTLPIIIGHLRIIRAFKQLDKLVDVEVSFYSETPDLFRAIGDKKLKDITTLVDLNHTCDTTTVFDNTQPYLYSLIDRGQKWDNSGTLNGRPINDANNGVWAADLTPSVKWSWLFEAIMSDAGFTYDATDLLNVLETYYMPFITRPTLRDPQEFKFAARLDASQFISSGNFLVNTIEIFDNNNVYSSDTFTAPVTTNFSFLIWTSMMAVGVGGGRIVEVYVTDITTNTEYFSGSLSSGFTSFVEGYTFISVPAIATHQYRIKYKIYTGAMVLVTTAQEFLDSLNLNGGCSWQVVGVGDISTNIPIFMSQLAPDIKQIDFIRDIISMHNCAIIPDRNEPNRFVMQSMSDYLESGNSIDWTSKLDISKDVVVESTTDFQKQNIVFTYSNGGDVASKFFNDIGQRTYGDYKINGYTVDATTPSNQFANGDITIKLTTQSTPAQLIDGTSYAIPKFINDKGEFVNPAMRCLFVGGSAEIQYRDTTGTTLETIPLLSHYSVINADYVDNDLNFAPETPLHDIVSSPYNNLFNLYWREYLNSLYSPQARIITANFALDLADILTFSFANIVWIKDSWWRVLEINDYKVGDSETTNVKLIKVVDPSVQCGVLPVGALVSGQIIWEDLDGNPALGTELCCSQYNWSWSEAKGACFGNITRRTEGNIELKARVINEIQAPVNALKSAVGLNADLSSQFSAYVGADIEVGANNVGTLAVGRSLKLDANKRGAALLGKNVLAKTSGLHLGGGWINDNSTNAEGGQQFGVVVFSGKDNVAVSMDTIPLFIEGINNEHIEFENDTVQVCTLTLNIVYDTFIGYASFQFQLQKDGAGVCTASVPILVYQESTGTASAAIIIDTTTNPDQHRILFQAYGTGFPYSYIVVGSLQYTQLR